MLIMGSVTLLVIILDGRSMAEVKEIKSFELALFPHQKFSAERVVKFVCDGGDWQDYQSAWL